MKKSKGKKQAKKRVRKVRARTIRHELVVRVDSQPGVPTVTDLAEPMKDGQKLTIPATWLSDRQIMRIVQRTPREHVYNRKGKGGKTFRYVTGSYVQRVLNFVFAWNWDFEVINHGNEHGHIWVQGRLTVRGNKPGQVISKTQFGRAEVKMLRDGKGMVDYGNDLKAATTDCMKKCASMFGIASDIYGVSDYQDETGETPRENVGVPVAFPVPVPGKSIIAIVEAVDCHGAFKGGCPGGNEITPSERDFSVKLFGKPLCRACQKDAPKKAV